MHEVIMSKLGLTMESGKIEKWHKKEGDQVETGDILFEVMTDKVSLEVESYNSGILRKIIKLEGDEVPVTEVVAYIGTADEEIPDTAGAAPAAEEVKEQAPAAEPEKPASAEPAKAVQPEGDEATLPVQRIAEAERPGL